MTIGREGIFFIILISGEKSISLMYFDLELMAAVVCV